jgi:hypothetical protein
MRGSTVLHCLLTASIAEEISAAGLIYFPLDIIFFFYFIVFTFTHMCIHCLGHLPSPHLASRQNLFLPLVLQFCWRENIRGNKKDTVFLLVWGKAIYADRFLVLLSCTCVLQPTLVHIYPTSSLLHSPLPIVLSTSFRLLCLLC